MSSKKHCDLCDAVIREDTRFEEGGYIQRSSLGGPDSNAGFESSMELCRPHYTSYKELIDEWRKLETGFMATFPTSRTSVGPR
jgi:hypothetical protein